RVPGLTVVRNGIATLEAAWGAELPVDPGLVRIEVRAPGHQTQTHEVQIAPRQHLTVRVRELSPLPAAAPAPVVAETGAPMPRSVVDESPATAAGSRAPQPRALRRRAGLGLLVVGALSVGAGIAAGALTLHERGQSDDACPE